MPLASTPAPPIEPLDVSISLSFRERQVLELLAVGRTDREVSEGIGISVATVRVYRKRLEAKLGAKGLVRCMLVAWRRGQLDLESIADEILGQGR